MAPAIFVARCPFGWCGSPSMIRSAKTQSVGERSWLSKSSTSVRSRQGTRFTNAPTNEVSTSRCIRAARSSGDTGTSAGMSGSHSDAIRGWSRRGPPKAG